MFDALFLTRVLVCVFFAILFLQSGFDKVFDWKGNREYIDGHFSNSPLAKMSPLLLVIITCSEVATGILSAGGVVIQLLGGNTLVATLAMLMACLSFLMLFTGQRVSKDYEGAQGLASYFIVALFGLVLMWPHWADILFIPRR